jgi:hypothetical protein
MGTTPQAVVHDVRGGGVGVAYAHPQPGETCARCNDLAARVVGTQPLCLDHFTSLLDGIHKSIARRELTPPQDMNPSALVEWGQRLRQLVSDGHITETAARHAWERAREFAA